MNGRDWEKNHRTQYAGVLNGLTPVARMDCCYRHHRDRERSLLQSLPGIFEQSRVLFVGCGTGEAAVTFWPSDKADPVGIDLHYSLASEARPRLGVVQADALALPYSPGSCDVVFYDLVLHHLVGQSSLEECLCEGARVLRPAGYLVAYEPSSFYPSNVALSFMNHFGAMNWLAGASPTEFALSPRAVIRILRELVGPTRAQGTTYCWRRMPVLLQRMIRAVELPLLRYPLLTLFGWHVLYVARKADSDQPLTGDNRQS